MPCKHTVMSSNPGTKRKKRIIDQLGKCCNLQISKCTAVGTETVNIFYLNGIYWNQCLFLILLFSSTVVHCFFSLLFWWETLILDSFQLHNFNILVVHFMYSKSRVWLSVFNSSSIEMGVSIHSILDINKSNITYQ